jgi:hypothetical protein
MTHTQTTHEAGSYAVFAAGLLGYLLLNLAVALSIWETAELTTGQQVLTWTVLLAPPMVLGALLAVPATRHAGEPWLRSLAIGCLAGAVLILVVALLGALSP